MRDFIIGKTGTDDKKNFFWNMFGSLIYAFASMLLTYLTIRLIGENEGGVFSIALTLAQMFIYIAYFEMRTYQVTDVKDRFQFSDYYTTKIITCIIMMFVSMFYILMQGYSKYKAVIVLLICFYRMIDGFVDVFESQFHKDGRLDLAGKSIAFRTIISVGGYFVILVITKNLLYGIIAMCLLALLAAWIFDIYVYRFYGNISLTKDIVNIIEVLKSCFPLFMGAFLWTYILSASRLSIDNNMSSEYQAYYQVLFMPVSVINLCAGFIMRPLLLDMTDYYRRNEIKKFLGIFIKVLIVILGMTILCMLGSLWIGPEILGILAGVSLMQYRNLLVFLMLAGGLNAFTFVLYYALSIMEKKNIIFAGYVIASVFSFISTDWFVKKYGMIGGAVSYFFVILGLNLFFMGSVLFYVKRKKGLIINEIGK